MHSGTRIGPYEIAAPIGAGGTGEVFRARDTRLNRDVAVKVLPKALVADVDRMRSEYFHRPTTMNPNHSRLFSTLAVTAIVLAWARAIGAESHPPTDPPLP